MNDFDRSIVRNSKYFIIIFLFICLNGFCQDNKWLFGVGDPNVNSIFGGGEIDFSQNQITISKHQMNINFDNTNANISDISGNILFYTNGISISNRLDSMMLGGDSLGQGTFISSYHDYGLPLNQAALILPMPNNSNLYYLFHVTVEHPNDLAPMHLYYSIIDMTLDNGNGGVVQKNQIAVNDKLFYGGLTAVRHANGRDWWVVVRKFNSNGFYELLLTPFGITNTNLINVAGLPHSPDPNLNFAQCVFSPEGNSYASYTLLSGIALLNFDRCDGSMSIKESISIPDSTMVGGISFSPNNRFMYANTNINVYQFDTDNPNISASGITVATYDNFYDSIPGLGTFFFLEQLAPNGKIYIGSAISTRYLTAIDQPDSFGTSCNVLQHSIVLPTYNSQTIPNHVNFKLNSIKNTICDSLVSINEMHSELLYHIYFIGENKYKIEFDNDVNLISYNIYNVLGKHILQGIPVGKNTVSFDLNNLSDGVYLVSCFTSKGVFNAKLFK